MICLLLVLMCTASCAQEADSQEAAQEPAETADTLQTGEALPTAQQEPTDATEGQEPAEDGSGSSTAQQVEDLSRKVDSLIEAMNRLHAEPAEPEVQTDDEG